MNTELEELLVSLERTAQRATRGPWQAISEPLRLNDVGRERGFREDTLLCETNICTTWDHAQLKGPMSVVSRGVGPYYDPTTHVVIRDEDAAHIAKCNPATILELIALVRQAVGQRHITVTDMDERGSITELHGFEAECSICLERERVPTRQEAEDWLKEHLELVHGGDTVNDK